MRDLLTDNEAARILGIRINKLYSIADFFDSDEDDDWALIEGEHFVFVQRGGEFRDRRFTEEGVEAIARYLERDHNGILSEVIEALTHRRRRRKRLLVKRRITQELIESGGIVRQIGNLAFVDMKTSRKILQTNGLGIRNAIHRLSHNDSLDGQEGIEIDKHFILMDDESKAWSQKGLASIALDMKENASISRSRKAWVEAVGEVVEDCFSRELRRIESAPNRIANAVRNARRASGNRCQLTGCARVRGRNLELHGHHLFDKSNRPDLADLHENILILEGNIHRDFHSWQGGSGCSPSDFLNYLNTARMDLVEASNARQVERQHEMTVRLIQLQRNWEGQHRYAS